MVLALVCLTPSDELDGKMEITGDPDDPRTVFRSDVEIDALKDPLVFSYYWKMMETTGRGN